MLILRNRLLILPAIQSVEKKEDLMAESFEINIPDEGQVDVEAVMRQVREYILARRRTDSSELQVLPHFEGQLNPQVYEHLYHATLLHDQVNVLANVIPSRVPIVGPVLTLARRKLHEVTLYYVHQLAQKQITFNAHILGAVNALTQEVEAAPPSEFTKLRQEVEVLRQQLKKFEEQV
jgi:hypothetical protein